MARLDYKVKLYLKRKRKIGRKEGGEEGKDRQK